MFLIFFFGFIEFILFIFFVLYWRYFLINVFRNVVMFGLFVGVLVVLFGFGYFIVEMFYE